VDAFTLTKIEFAAVRRILSQFACCSLGKSLALHIGPSRNPETVRTWLRQTSEMVEAVREVGLPPFAGVTDVSEALKRARPGAGASGEDFAAIASALEGAANVRGYLNALGEELEGLHEFAKDIGSFEGEVEAVRAVVDARGDVRDDASERLAGIRSDIATTTREIHDAIYGYLKDPDVARLLQDANVTLHGDRYVLPVKVENRGRLPGVVHRESNTGATVFVEPTASVELNNRLSDLRTDERREIERLLHQLSVRLMGRTKEIASTLRVLGQVDLLAAKAQYAYQFDMTCPEVAENGPLELSQARHPLLIDQARRAEKSRAAAGEAEQAAAPEVVPIDVRLGQDFDLLVITGPNTGGKTVTLKTVALLAVMAQSGMHIPARREASLPVFRDVYIDIGDEQSLEQSLSTFGAHIKRIRYILRKADRASLVLLDELGAGTDPDEGGAIGQAILDELRRVGCLGMVTTHLSVLKAYAMTHERVDNASVEFDTRTLSPLYHLHIGTPGESHAITVAQRLGLGKRIVAAARKHRDRQGRQFRKAIRATGQARQVAEQARQQAREARLAAEAEQESYQAKLADLHRLQEDFEGWLAGLPEWKPGDEIHVPSLEKTGRLVRLELHKQVAVVDTGNVQVEVPLRELMPDLGQSALRKQIRTLRRQIMEQAEQTEEARAEIQRMRDELHQSVLHQKERARQFDTWLGAIARAKVGDEVTFSRKPGRGKLVKMDLPALKATVATDRGEIDLPIQDLFPQTGPFAPRQGRRARRGGRAAPGGAALADRPIPRRSPHSRAAKASRQAVVAIQPGSEVFVIPFHKRATLIRVNEEKDEAVVQSGVFEMTIALSDLEPVRERRPRGRQRGG
jgi:DNA mismatch repair protein MutS2